MHHLVKEPKTKRGQQTLQKIINSAKTLFYEKGYYNTSINDITAGAGIAPGTYYIYFSDKLSLYSYILLQFSHDIRKSISVATEKYQERYDKEYHGLKAYLDFIRVNPSAYRIIWESQYVDPKLFTDYYENFAKRYAKGLVEAQNNQEIKEVNPTTLAYLLMGVSNFIGLKYVIFEDHNYDQVVDDVTKVIFEGIKAHK
jgi:AcrR family transcriptional regulator